MAHTVGQVDMVGIWQVDINEISSIVQGVRQALSSIQRAETPQAQTPKHVFSNFFFYM